MLDVTQLPFALDPYRRTKNATISKKTLSNFKFPPWKEGTKGDGKTNGRRGVLAVIAVGAGVADALHADAAACAVRTAGTASNAVAAQALAATGNADEVGAGQGRRAGREALDIDER